MTDQQDLRARLPELPGADILGAYYTADQMRAYALEAAAQLPAGVPDGWVLVPKEPTDEMRVAAASFGGRGGYSSQRGDEACRSYLDMLAAAPQPDSQKSGEGEWAEAEAAECACTMRVSNNGALICADCGKNIEPQPDSAAPGGDVEQRARELLARELDEIRFPAMAAEIRDETGYNTLGAAMVRVVAAVLLVPGGGVEHSVVNASCFKNFHRSLCARFGYTHDEVYWWRDLVSLEEHIASLSAPKQVGVPTPCPVCAGFCGDKGPTCEERFAASPPTISNEQRNSARYRWLRSLCGREGCSVAIRVSGNSFYQEPLTPEMLDSAIDAAISPQAAPVPVEGEAVFWMVPGLDRVCHAIAGAQDEHRVVLTTKATDTHTVPLYLTPPEQPAIDLEQFRPAVEATKRYGERLHAEGAFLPEQYDDWMEKADRLLAIIDGAKAGPKCEDS